MKNMLLEASQNPGTNIWSYVLIGVVVLLLIALPVVMNARNKKESQKVQEQTNSLKVGDKVLTTSGIYGTITEVKFDDAKKTVVLETGGKEKSFLTIDAYAIYTVFKSDAELAREAEIKAEAEKKFLEEEEAKRQAKKDKKKKSEVQEKVASEIVSEQEENK